MEKEKVGYCVRWDYSHMHNIFTSIQMYELCEEKKAIRLEKFARDSGFDDVEFFPLYKIEE